jgi:hypothetical protein
MTPELDQRLVTRYAKLKALERLLEKWLATARNKLLAGFESGARCPTRGPFLLSVGPAKVQPSWQKEFEGYLVAEYVAVHGDGHCDDAHAHAIAVMAEIEARPRATITRIYCRPNPNYRRKFPIRLPL